MFSPHNYVEYNQKKTCDITCVRNLISTIIYDIIKYFYIIKMLNVWCHYFSSTFFQEHHKTQGQLFSIYSYQHIHEKENPPSLMVTFLEWLLVLVVEIFLEYYSITSKLGCGSIIWTLLFIRITTKPNVCVASSIIAMPAFLRNFSGLCTFLLRIAALRKWNSNLNMDKNGSNGGLK